MKKHTSSRSPPAKTRSSARRKRVFVLVVDDVSDNREMYTEYLRYSGFQTLEAADGKTAIDLARTHHPSVILMDLALPGIGGWEATKILKADPATRDILIVAVSGHAEEMFQARAKEAGCDLFIVKPMVPSELTAAVVRLLDQEVRAVRRRGG